MEVKQMKCETCLSSDRQLVCLSKIRSIIYEIQLPQIINTDGGVCWECHSNMVKFYKFKIQVKHAQDELATNNEHLQIKSLSNLSSHIKKNYDFEYTYYDDPLTSANAEENIKEIKAEPILLKQEADIYFEDRINSDSDHDNTPLSMVFADSIQIKNVDNEKSSNIEQAYKKIKEDIPKTINLKKEHNKEEKNEAFLEKELNRKSTTSDLKKECIKVQKKDDSKEVLKEKFETVIFTDEEMLKCREDKRNHANFKKIPYKCSSCVLGFIKKENYDMHIKKIHDESIGPHSCTVCEARFSTEAGVTHHKTRHYLQYRCKLCEYKVSFGTAAMKHARDKHAGEGTARIQCEECAFVARTSDELLEHVKTKHSFACVECGIKFKGRHTLRSHNIRIHAVKREFSCEVCSRTFVSKSRFESHLSAHSAAAAARLSYCAQCRVQYKTIQIYRNHLRNNVRHVQDRVPCPDCDKKFASKVYLTKHYNFYHLRRSQFKCHDCDKLFMSKWRLKIHKQKHHGLSRTRDHACTVCGKKFYTKATLLSHSLLHAASRAFMCARCGATFRQSAALYTHTRLTHRTASQPHRTRVSTSLDPQLNST